MLAFDTDASPNDVVPTDRSLGDYLSPRRSGRAVDVLNAVVRDVGGVAESWPWERVVRFAVLLRNEAMQQRTPE